jgi:hypothetical protein
LQVPLIAERQVAISAPLLLPFTVLAFPLVLALAALVASVVVPFRMALVMVSAPVVRDVPIVAVMSTGVLPMRSRVSRVVDPVFALVSADSVTAVDMMHRGDAEQEQASDAGHVMGRDPSQLVLEGRLEVVARRGLGRPDEEPESQACGQARNGSPGVLPTRWFLVYKALRDDDAHDLSRPPSPPVCGLIG